MRVFPKRTTASYHDRHAMYAPHPLKQPLDLRARAFVRALRQTLGGEVEPLHQCRVATRRLRELLPLCEAEYAGRAVTRARRRVRRLGRALGPVRELDVAYALVDELEQAGTVRPAGAARLRRRVQEERGRHRERMLVRLSRPALGKLARDVADVQKAIAMREATDGWALVLATRIDRRAERLRDTVNSAGAMYVSERVHAARISAKQLRYALELAVETGAAGTQEEPASKAVGRLKQSQDTLGRLHDLEILQGLIQSIEPPAAFGEPWTQQLDTLDRELTAECRRLHGAFVAAQPALLDVSRTAHRLATRICNAHGGRTAAGRILKMSLGGSGPSRMESGGR